MEFEKLQSIIAEVMSVDPDEITMDTRFTDDLGASRMHLRLRFPPKRRKRFLRSAMRWRKSRTRLIDR